MAHLCLHIWSALVAFIGVAYSINDGYLEEPSSTTARAGDTVTLSCVISAAPTSYVYVYWYKSYGFSESPSMPISSLRTMNTNVDERYSIVGSGSRYDLQISNVKVGDTSFYLCKYYTGRYFSSQIAHLLVYDHSLVPRCLYFPANPDVGSTVQMTCSPGSSLSRGELSLWRGENGHQITTIGRQSDGSITYRFQIRPNDNNRSYTCSYGRTFESIHNCSIKPLIIEPTISLTPNINFGLLDDMVRFSCVATGLPKFNNYKWMVGTGPSALRISETFGRYTFSTNGDSARLTIYRLQQSDNNTAVRCIALNDLSQRQVAVSKIIVHPAEIIPTELPTLDAITTSVGGVFQETKSGPEQGDIPSDDLTATTTNTVKSVGIEGLPKGESQEEIHIAHEETNLSSTSKRTPSRNGNSIILPVLLTLTLLILIAIIIILIIYVRKTDKKPSKILKRLSVSKPKVLNRVSISRPLFLEGGYLRKSWQDAKQKVEDLQRRVSASRASGDSNEDEKRESLRDHHIEVLVNPPPPEWKIKVEDVDTAQRQRRLSPQLYTTGGYSAKEQDLLNSFLTGTIKVKSMDKIQGMDIIQSADEADSQVGSEFDEDNFDELPESQREIKTVRPSGGRDEPIANDEENKVVQTPNMEEAIYANTNLDTSENTEKEGGLKDDLVAINYAELDLNLVGPWDGNVIIQTEPKTAYAVIDHTKRNPVVRTECE